MEIESATQAASNIKQEHSERLADILHRHSRAFERRQFIDAITVDDEFHAQIAMISNLPRLWKTIEISKAQIDRCRHMMLPRAGQAEATLEQHREIIRALNSHDPDRAATAMRAHLDSAYRSAAAVLDAANLSDTRSSVPAVS